MAKLNLARRFYIAWDAESGEFVINNHRRIAKATGMNHNTLYSWFRRSPFKTIPFNRWQFRSYANMDEVHERFKSIMEEIAGREDLDTEARQAEEAREESLYSLIKKKYDELNAVAA